jgi:adenylate cyclase
MSRSVLTRVALAAGAGALASASLVGGLAWRGELVSADLRQRWLPAHLPSAPRVIVVAIDDDSLRAAASEPSIRNWPWPRWTYARMLEVLAWAKPAVIGIDILFPEPREGDDELAARLRELSAVLACDAGTHGGGGGVRVPGPPPVEAPSWGVVSPPVAGLAAAAPYATIHVEADADGITRAFPLVTRYEGTSLASLPLALARQAGATVESGRDGVRVNGRRATASDGKLWLRFGGSFPSFVYVPAWRVLKAWQAMFDGEEPPAATGFLMGVEGAVVIVSATATGAFDLRPTPVAALSPGSEVQATAVANLLCGRWVSPPTTGSQVAGAVGLALLVGVLSLRLRRPVELALSGLALVVAWCVAAGAAWGWADAWLPVCLPVLGGVVAIPTLLIEGWWREGAERRRVQGIFGRYVAPDILRVLLEHPESARLGGERRRITVLFSDIRSYTTLSENLAPEEVVGWLNEYFSEQVAVIHAHRGTVDKFIGDAVMAFWGAPLPEAEQERLAASCAAEMIRTSRRLAGEWRGRGGPPLAIGVGIATGDAVVGNVGSEQLRAYTAIGDTVNLASRLEGKTKDLAVPVVLDETTAQACGLPVRSVGEVTVKGRAAAVRVFALSDLDVH